MPDPYFSIKIKIHGNFEGLQRREVEDFFDASLAGDFGQNLADLFL